MPCRSRLAIVAMFAVFLWAQIAPRAQRDLVFPYGADYFRKSNPPEEGWARDHQTASKIGMNAFRHWFIWSAIEVAPGKYDWRDYDRMMDLAAQSGIKVVIAEMITAAPEWMFDTYAHASYRGSDDTVVHSQISSSSATGGFPTRRQGDCDLHAAGSPSSWRLVVVRDALIASAERTPRRIQPVRRAQLLRSSSQIQGAKPCRTMTKSKL